MNSSITDNLLLESRENSLKAFRLRSVEQLPVMAQEESCHILKQYFDYLENSLSKPAESDIGLLQEMLLEISGLLRSGKSQLEEDGYFRLLNRLTSIYAKGLQTENDWAFAQTAANFADILQSISHAYQDYDYSHSVGLLLHYMDRLFNYEEESWLEVFEHLRAMPDSIDIMQQLKDQYLHEIQNWVEEGVDNLFTIRNEQVEILANLDQTMMQLDKEVSNREMSLLRQVHSAHQGNIVEMRHQFERREIYRLREESRDMLKERESKLEIINLLDVNIQEFADRITDIRRRAIMRLAWNNPVSAA
jgi:molybdopterin converting factor small subunit